MRIVVIEMVYVIHIEIEILVRVRVSSLELVIRSGAATSCGVRSTPKPPGPHECCREPAHLTGNEGVGIDDKSRVRG